MTTKKSTAKKAAAPKAPKAKEKGTAPIVELPKGTGTQDAPPPPSNPDPIERGSGEREPKERGTDTLRLPEDKARWNYGESTDIATLHAEQRQIDADNAQ